jgi:hypothetical protein
LPETNAGKKEALGDACASFSLGRHYPWRRERMSRCRRSGARHQFFSPVISFSFSP